MRAWHVGILIVALLASTFVWSQEQKDSSKAPVPKYDVTQEQDFKGTIEEIRDRQCPVSGGMGAHVMLKLGDGQILEVHLAKTKFVKDYELTFTKGEQIEVKGVKVKFEGADTIFAREVKRGNDMYMFRDKDGKPIW
jgi:DNA/RNA endonuclease YhcR with UshA esterase domain